MIRSQHHRAFFITVYWTLGLLFLGSIVHATESSLACPDWPTCFGTMLPDMVGGVFWEHLHRLVAGGLILFFGGALYLAWREGPSQPWIVKATAAGLGLLLIQSVLGGVTVLLRLPDAVSTSHLGLAFVFLGLAAVLATVTSPSWDQGIGPSEDIRGKLRKIGISAVVLAFSQSIVGAAVRHTDAGMACPDIPLCLGQWIPPLSYPTVALHFGHRVLGLAVMAMALWVGHIAFWKGRSAEIARMGVAAALVAMGQVLLGFLSVFYRLAVEPVSLHTLLAAILLVLLVRTVTLTWAPGTARDARTALDEGARPVSAAVGNGESRETP
ncbi:MAG: COX15/CtaA family protein [Gemmatimonadota bacterium]|jgi:heme A synthase